ncbi:ubiquinone biosynthesis O-methyltransferase [Striga asiatica]|uniref:Ubiquinone biosynthesis O-methyltransferase n=1 Tax=Striga asiatica TaxID=4170 RepID=A0A5A7QLM2_STRAF|nr:ubiquinone biosynthesis O-methyltransferase [Striga asiatica]
MVPKHLLTGIHTLARPICHSARPTNLCSYPEFLHKLQTRHYSIEPPPVTLAFSSPLASTSNPKSSLNEAELQKFAAISGTWWDGEGPFKPLHVMNTTRLAFIRSTLCRHFGLLSTWQILLIVECFLYGICLLAQVMRQSHLRFASFIDHRGWVIEHVADPSDFFKSLSALTSFGGATVISTINRSMRAYATAILMAEYLPRGTHQWSSFLTPEELVLILERASISVKEMAGFVYDPLTGRWSLSADISVNFIAYGTKNGE